ncbi:MAG TPA: PEP-CTERM sorting domain-containing protein [Myxococcota bacterium]|nr:PEP-CTERM sorting domain-containing protein [Myxococcota bacterium]
MRTVWLVLFSSLLWVAGAWAQAMSISPNPVTEVRGSGSPGGSLSASLAAVSVSGNQAVFQLSVVTGSITGIDVGMLMNSIASPSLFDFVAGASFAAGSGIGGTASVASGGTQAQFAFASVVGAGAATRPLVVTFASAIPTSWQGTVNFDNGFATTHTFTVVPEPLSLALLGAGLSALALARRNA